MEQAPLAYPAATSGEESHGRIQYQLGHNTSTFHTRPQYKDPNIRNATDIELWPNNMNSEDGFCQSKSFKPLICSLKNQGNPPSQDLINGFPVEPCTST
jgi:hypothetical protein